MKRTLAALIATAAAVLAFVMAVNFFPDWTWEVLNTVREAKTRIFEKKTRALELSKYALPPGTSVEEEQVNVSSESSYFLLELALIALAGMMRRFLLLPSKIPTERQELPAQSVMATPTFLLQLPSVGQRRFAPVSL